MSWWWYIEGDCASDYERVERNVTYNVGNMLALALGAPVREWDSKTLREIGQAACRGLVRIAEDRAAFLTMEPANGWGSLRSVIGDLLWLAGWMAHAPDARLRVS